MNLTSAHESECQGLWNTCEVRPQRPAAKEITDGLFATNAGTRRPANRTAYPGTWVGIIHQFEGSGF